MKDDILNTIQETLYVPDGEISETTRIDDITQNSMDLIELISVLRSQFNVSVKPEELDKVTTVGDIVEYVKNHQDELNEEDDQSLDMF